MADNSFSGCVPIECLAYHSGWNSPTITYIDNTIAGADGQFASSAANPNFAYLLLRMSPMPSDFGAMKTLSVNVRYKLENTTNDHEILEVDIGPGFDTGSGINSIVIADTTTAIALTNTGNLSVTLSASQLAASKDAWDCCEVLFWTTHEANMGNDGSIWYIDEIELSGTYEAAPEITLDSPSDTATNQSLTPALVFTGTSDQSLSGEYQVQVHTDNNFAPYNYYKGGSWECIRGDANYLYSSDWWYGFNVWSRSDFTKQSISLTQDGAGSITMDDTYYYVSQRTTSGGIYRIPISGFPGAGYTLITTFQPYATGLLIDNGYLYAVGSQRTTGPGNVVRSATPNLTSVTTVQVDATYAYGDLYCDGTYIFGVCGSNKIFRVPTANFTAGAVETLSLSTVSGIPYATYDGTYAYIVGTSASQNTNYIERVNISTWQLSSARSVSVKTAGSTGVKTVFVGTSYIWTLGIHTSGRGLMAIAIPKSNFTSGTILYYMLDEDITGFSATKLYVDETNMWVFTASIWLGTGESTRLWSTLTKETTDVYYSVKYSIKTLVTDVHSSTDSGFTAGHPFASGTQVTYTVPSNLSTSTTYYWHVRGKSPSGSNNCGAWSSTYSFTTGSGTGYKSKIIIV